MRALLSMIQSQQEAWNGRLKNRSTMIPTSSGQPHPLGGARQAEVRISPAPLSSSVREDRGGSADSQQESLSIHTLSTR